jgi:hypothetical protein
MYYVSGNARPPKRGTPLTRQGRATPVLPAPRIATAERPTARDALEDGGERRPLARKPPLRDQPSSRRRLHPRAPRRRQRIRHRDDRTAAPRTPTRLRRPAPHQPPRTRPGAVLSVTRTPAAGGQRRQERLATSPLMHLARTLRGVCATWRVAPWSRDGSLAGRPVTARTALGLRVTGPVLITQVKSRSPPVPELLRRDYWWSTGRAPSAGSDRSRPPGGSPLAWRPARARRRSGRLGGLRAARGPRPGYLPSPPSAGSTLSRRPHWRPTRYGRPGKPLGPRVGPVCLDVVRVATPTGGRKVPWFPSAPRGPLRAGRPAGWFLPSGGPSRVALGMRVGDRSAAG